MLSLTRRVGESLMIGDDIKIEILDIEFPRGASGKGQVKIGIFAPSNIRIYREEIYLERKKSGNEPEPEK